MIQIKSRWLFGMLPGILLAGLNCIAGEFFPLADQWFFSERVSGEWQNRIPAEAVPFALKDGKINLDLLRGGAAGKEHDTAVIYNRFLSERDGTLSIGFGCDWWMQVFCNGREYLNTMKSGNGSSSYSPWNHPVQVPVKKGMNLLAAKLIRGKYSFTFVCGAVPPIPELPQILARRTLPPPPPAGSGSSYQLILLGDTHFDAPYEVYHSAYNEPDEKLNRIQRAEFARNEAIWRERGPRMLKAAAGQITDRTRAVVQVGDLVQGDCGSPETHERMMLDTLSAFKASFHALPFLTVPGNHDVRGPGAAEACRRILLPYLSRELNRKITSTTFHFMLEDDLYVFIDFNEPDCDAIRKAFAEHPDARYKFVVTHGPVLPADSKVHSWFLFGSDADNVRRYFRELFLRNDVIVLTGHVHALELLECATDSGRITQLMANSVWSAEPLAQYIQEAGSAAEYGRNQKEVFRNSDGIRLLAEYQPAVTRYWHARGAGYFRLDIAPDGVVAHYFGGDSATPSRTIRLR